MNINLPVLPASPFGDTKRLEDSQLLSGHINLDALRGRDRLDSLESRRRPSTDLDAQLSDNHFRLSEDSTDISNDLDVVFEFDEDMPFVCGTSDKAPSDSSPAALDTFSAFKYNDRLADPPVLQSFLKKDEDLTLNMVRVSLLISLFFMCLAFSYLRSSPTQERGRSSLDDTRV